MGEWTTVGYLAGNNKDIIAAVRRRQKKKIFSSIAPWLATPFHCGKERDWGGVSDEECVEDDALGYMYHRLRQYPIYRSIIANHRHTTSLAKIPVGFETRLHLYHQLFRYHQPHCF